MPKTSVQQSFPPMPLDKCSGDRVVRTKDSKRESARTKDSGQPDNSTILAATLFDAALSNARDIHGNTKPITSGEVAHLLGVSESLVNRMRSVNYREGVSFTQMLRLPPSFHLSLHREMNRRFGFGRQALLDLLDAAGVLALAVER